MRAEEVIRVGTRKSPLAQAQTDRVLAALPHASLAKVLVESAGDLDTTRPIHEMERPGAFTSVLTDAILDGRIDAAVHSLKDLPLAAPAEAPIVAILARDDAADVIIARDDATDASRAFGLRAGARVGTSAPRRQTQVLDADPDLVPVDVRGNVGTRLKLLEAGVVDALLMAAAAFERLPLALPPRTSMRRLDPREHPGSPGQGAIAVQARRGSRAATLLAALDDPETRRAVEAEREILHRLGGGCGMPLGAHAWRDAGAWHLTAALGASDWHDRALPRVATARLQGDDPATLAAQAVLALAEAPAPVGHAPPARTLALTLSPDACAPYAARLAPRGWRALSWPLLVDEPTGAPLPSAAADARWIAATSPRAAPYAREAYERGGSRARIAALGPATARALRHERLPVHVVSREGHGASLADAIAAFPAPPQTVLLAQAEDALPDLAEGLAKDGSARVAWSCYRVRAAAPAPPFPRDAEIVVVTSPSNARALAAAPPATARVVAFGRATEAALVAAGVPVWRTLARPTPAGLLEVLP